MWIGPLGTVGTPTGSYEDVDAIQTVDGAKSPQRFYNLQGQPVAVPSRGIFINQRGQKVVVK